MQATVDAFMDEYIRRYSERDVEGVAELCLAPFLAIREGVPIHMPDRDAVRHHFAAMIDTFAEACAPKGACSRNGRRKGCAGGRAQTVPSGA